MLTGRFTWVDATERKRPSTCITLAFSGEQELRYSDQRRMGRWCIVPKGKLDAVPGFSELAEDALAIDEESFVANLRKRRGQIKNTLVNQKFIAGIGNAYSNEILWEAQIHPHRRGSTLEDEDRARLYRAILATFEWARPMLEAEVSEGLYQRNEEWRDHLRAHRQEGEDCPPLRLDGEGAGAERSRDELLSNLSAALRLTSAGGSRESAVAHGT
jgi:formamidopyrimidine-DNA glycosylase